MIPSKKASSVGRHIDTLRPIWPWVPTKAREFHGEEEKGSSKAGSLAISQEVKEGGRGEGPTGKGARCKATD